MRGLGVFRASQSRWRWCSVFCLMCFLGLSYRLLSGNKVSPLTCGYADRAGQERCSDNLSSCDGDYGSYIGSNGVPYIGSC